MFLKEHVFRLENGVLQAKNLKEGDRLRILHGVSGYSEDPIYSILIQTHTGSLCRLNLSDGKSLLMHPAHKILSFHKQSKERHLIALVDCEGKGYCLTMLETVPRLIEESPLFESRTGHKIWSYRQLWFLKGFTDKDEADYWLNLLSLRYQLPILDARKFQDNQYHGEMLRSLFHEMATLRQWPVLKKEFHLEAEPDFVVLQDLQEADPVFGFVLLNYRPTAASSGHRLFLASGNLKFRENDDSIALVNRDLFMVRKDFHDRKEIKAWILAHLGMREARLLYRYHREGHILSARSVQSLPLGTHVLGTLEEKPHFFQFLSQDKVEIKERTMIDLRFKTEGFVQVDGLEVYIASNEYQKGDL